jgi:hypothetical protein
MKKMLSIFLVILVSAILVSTALAGGPHNKATGTITWTARSGTLPGLVTSFNAHDSDGAPGSQEDRGSIETYRPFNPDFEDEFPEAGSITIELECVHVDGLEAWFAGTATSASGGYSGLEGQVYLYWVKDVSTPGSAGPDLLGGRKYDTISIACNVANNGSWAGEGAVTDGNLNVFYAED